MRYLHFCVDLCGVCRVCTSALTCVVCVRFLHFCVGLCDACAVSVLCVTDRMVYVRCLYFCVSGRGVCAPVVVTVFHTYAVTCVGLRTVSATFTCEFALGYGSHTHTHTQTVQNTGHTL